MYIHATTFILLLLAGYYGVRKDALNEALFEAIKNNDTSTVAQLLKDGANPNATNFKGGFPRLTPLLYAARDGHCEIVDLLIKAQANVDYDFFGTTALHNAVEAKAIECVKMLLKAGANVNAKIRDSGWTPLHRAVRNNHSEIASELIDAGADLEARELFLGGTAFEDAVGKNDPNLAELFFKTADTKISATLVGKEINPLLHPICNIARMADLFLKNGLSSELKNSSKRSLLYQVLHATSALQEIFQAGVVPPVHGNTTALAKAACEGNVLITHQLIDLKNDANVEDSLRHSACGGHIQSTKVLLDAGVKAQDSVAMYLAVGFKSPEVVRLLIKYGAILPPTDGDRLINNAISEGTLDTVELLVKASLDEALKNDSLSERIDHILTIDSNPLNSNVDAELIKASAHNQLDKVDSLIKNGAHVDTKNAWGWTPLRWATRRGYTQLAELLIKAGANVNVKDNEGWTPLYWAAYWGHSAIVKALINGGGRIHDKSNNNFTALHAAVREGHKDIVELLIRKGANVNSKALIWTQSVTNTLCGGTEEETDVNQISWTPLHFAAFENDPDVIKMLINAGADVNAHDENGATPLRIAIIQGSNEAAEALVSSGAFVDPTLLPLAAYLKSTKIVELLIKAGADITAQDAEGYTALYSAVLVSDINMAKFLLTLDRGMARSYQNSQVHLKTKNGRTPLHSAAARGPIQLVELLIDAGAEVNARENHDWTPLHWASYRGNTDIIEKLLQAGADVHAKDAKGWTLLHIAAFRGNGDLTQKLVEYLDVNIQDNKGKTPLHYAAENGQALVAKALIKTHANINAQDKKGRTPLHLALENNQVDMVQYLINAGAHVNAKTKTGMSPLHMAVIEDLRQCSEMLIKAGADMNAKNSEGVSPLDLVLRQNGEAQQSNQYCIFSYCW